MRKIVLVAVLALSAVISSASVALAASPGKAWVCHNGHTISVSVRAVPAHVAHGDAVGACV